MGIFNLNLRVWESGFDVLGIFAGHSDVATFRSLELFRLAEIVVILLGFATNHFAVFGNFYLFGDGFSGFLLHRVNKLLRCDDNVESAGEAFDVFFNSEGRLDGVHKLSDGISCTVHRSLFATTKDDLYFHLVSS